MPEANPPIPRPLTVEQVAERWGCSDNHVRNLIKRGELRAFRLGHRLLRVPTDAVVEYEQRQVVEPTLEPAYLPVSDVIVISHARERGRRK